MTERSLLDLEPVESCSELHDFIRSFWSQTRKIFWNPMEKESKESIVLLPVLCTTATTPSSSCANRTLFDGLVIGHVNDAFDRCSEQLKAIQGSNTPGLSFFYLNASSKKIAKLAITKLPDTISQLRHPSGVVPGQQSIPQFATSSLEKLSLVNNPISSLADVYVPSTVHSLDLSNSPLKLLDGLAEWNIAELTLQDNNITDIHGIAFPSTLKNLSLAGNSLHTFEIAQRDVDLFKKQNTFEAEVSRTACDNPKASLVEVKTVKLCVLPDEEWDHLNKSSSALTNSTGIIIIAVAASVVFVAIVLAVVWRKRRHHGSTVNTSQPTDGYSIQKDSPTDDITDPVPNKSDLAAQRATDQPDLGNDPDLAAIRIPSNRLTQGERIGRGAFGEVFKGVCDGKTVAIKRLYEDAATGLHSSALRSLVGEVRLIAQLYHPNLVTLIGVAWDTDSLENLRVVYEFMNRGDLRRLLLDLEQSGRPKGFDKAKIRIALDVANGLRYLHERKPKVYHRDLKSRNILLDDKLHAKLSDFGSSRRMSEQTMTMTANTGTDLWMAPEVLMGQRYDEKVDIFSFGVVLSELDTHLLPYTQAMQDEDGHRRRAFALLQQVAFGSLRVSFTHSSEEDPVVALANACVSVDPQERPTADQVSYELEMILHKWKTL